MKKLMIAVLAAAIFIPAFFTLSYAKDPMSLPLDRWVEITDLDGSSYYVPLLGKDFYLEAKGNHDVLMLTRKIPQKYGSPLTDFLATIHFRKEAPGKYDGKWGGYFDIYLGYEPTYSGHRQVEIYIDTAQWNQGRLTVRARAHSLIDNKGDVQDQIVFTKTDK